jgi:hypothetical protein
MSFLKDQPNEQRFQVSFRVSEKAWERLQRTARIFELAPGAYVKALLYANLGLYDERIDKRRKSWRQRYERKKK